MTAETFLKQHFNGIEKETWYPAIVALAEGYANSQTEAKDKEIGELKKKYEDAFELINELDGIYNIHPTTKRLITNYLNKK